MKKSRFSDTQIIEILKEGEAGVPISDLIRKHGISRPTYFNWRAKYGGVNSSELKRVKELEQESAKLKTHVCGPRTGKHCHQGVKPRLRKRWLRCTWQEYPTNPWGC